MSYRLKIVTDDCMSSGKCVGDFPATFAFDDDELAVAIADGAALSDADLLRAARNCPSRALKLFDEQGNELRT